MSITFIGDNFESTNRVLTGCYSLDWALGDSLGNFGIPVRSVFEVYGAKNVGKSTFCFSLLGLIAKALGKNISILDWEGQSRETIEGVLVNQGFMGQVNYLLNKGDESSEDSPIRSISFRKTFPGVTKLSEDAKGRLFCISKSVGCSPIINNSELPEGGQTRLAQDGQ